MVRDPLKSSTYFDAAIAFEREQIQDREAWLAAGKAPSHDKACLCAYRIYQRTKHIMIMSYSRGDSLSDIKEQLGHVVQKREALIKRAAEFPERLVRYETLTVDHYRDLLWLLSCAVCLKAEPHIISKIVGFGGRAGQDIPEYG